MKSTIFLSLSFLIGGLLAQKLDKGFLVIRKSGKMCVETDSLPYRNYSQSEHRLEIRKNPFPPGTRVLVYDQWIETGGTMEAAVKLVEEHDGVITGQ